MGLIDSYLKDQVLWEAQNGHDIYGGTLFAAPVTLRARAEDKTQMVLNSTGALVVSEAEIWVQATWSVRVDDYMTVSGKRYRVVKVSPLSSFSKKSHQVIYLGG